MKVFRNRRIIAINALVFSLLMVLDCVFATATWALTGGPSQPEVSSFTPISTSDLVNLSTGDFNYNIPLLDVGGYPINISYNSGVSMDEEASWVGLGWNVNPGVINRNMRGLPDDFNGLGVRNEFNIKTDKTYGIEFSPDVETFGISLGGANITASIGANWNSYNGIGLNIGLSINAAMEKSFMAKNTQFVAKPAISIGSGDDGLDVRASVGLSATESQQNGIDNVSSGNLGLGFNSKSGFTGLTMSSSIGNKVDRNFDENSDKEDRSEGGVSTGTSISLLPNTYSPNIQTAKNNLAISFNVEGGGDIFGVDINGEISGYYSNSKLKDGERDKSVRSYGYIYEQNSSGKADQHDFNRDNDGPYNENVKRLPITNHTYDIFSASGQGVSGQFRPYRNDVGVLHDAYVKSTGQDGSGGIEFGGGAGIKLGSDVIVNISNNESGEWTKNNEARKSLKFERRENTASNFEPSYFKEVGELAVDDEMILDGAPSSPHTFLEKIGGYDPVRVKLGTLGRALNTLEKSNGTAIESPNSNERYKQKKRKKRNQLFSYLSVRQAVNYAVRPENIITTPAADNTGATSGYEDQIGEVTVLKNDGSRYVYGKPLFNTKHKEVTFNAEGRSINPCDKGLVEYTEGDASADNQNGLDNYFLAKTLPPYAHSYVITEILSTDYSDSDNEPGPSYNDYGNYTKFNYKSIENYQWRTPYNKANFNEGFKSQQNDNKGNYTYGEKNLAYLSSVETKTHIAIFKTSPRKDALSARGEHGGEDSKSMEKLESVTLYSLPEYTTLGEYNPQTGEGAEPIKTVHFTYDYLLGSGENTWDSENDPLEIPSVLPNSVLRNNPNASVDGIIEKENQGGKLTLREVYFSYGKSNKAKLSKYEFNYENKNYPYDIKAYDVWGNYKPSNMEAICENTNTLIPSTPEFPYVVQDENANDYASAWHMSEILLPSGGSINLEFESDDYLYVQDKRAMQMFRVLGTADDSDVASENLPNIFGYTEDSQVVGDSDITDKLYNDDGDKEGKPWAVIASEQELTPEEWNKALGSFKSGSDLVQFRFLVDVDRNGTGSFEYISGYAKLDGGDSHKISESNSKYAWIKFKGVKKENKKNDFGASADNHPVAKAGWNFTRKYLPRVANDLDEINPDGGNVDIIKELADASIIGSLIESLQGPNGALKHKKKSRVFKRGRSWVRLNCPKDLKYGGGSRIKTITSNDNWSSMTSDARIKDSQFGQQYTYKTPDGKSSGVASYEPLMSKENPLVQVLNYDNNNIFTVPDYVEEPIGASFYPSPSVTYSRVEVSDIIYDDNELISESESRDLNGDGIDDMVTTNRTGYVVNEFYTTKDFPTKYTPTGINPKLIKNPAIGGLIGANNLLAVSQGYAIEINDMDGKPKSTRVYGIGQESAISGVDYAYEETLEDSGNPFSPSPESLDQVQSYSLNNSVVTIDEKGKVSTSVVGVEVDVVSDFRENYSKTRSYGVKLNMNVLFLFLPIPTPTVYPSSVKNRTRFRSSVITKVINRRGILRETIAFDNGASVSTKNLAYDANTGQVLLTSTKNEFGDEIYNLNLPAYWAYKEMGQASENIGYSRAVVTNEVGRIDVGDSQYFVYGDELAILDGSGRKGWLWHTQNGNTQDNRKYIIDTDGNAIHLPTATNVRVIKSGYKNTHSSSMSSMTLMANPLEGLVNGRISIDASKEIIDVSNIEYSDRWKTFGELTPMGQQYEDAIGGAPNSGMGLFYQNLFLDGPEGYDNAFDTTSEIINISDHINDGTLFLSDGTPVESTSFSTFKLYQADDCQGRHIDFYILTSTTLPDEILAFGYVHPFTNGTHSDYDVTFNLDESNLPVESSTNWKNCLSNSVIGGFDFSSVENLQEFAYPGVEYRNPNTDDVVAFPFATVDIFSNCYIKTSNYDQVDPNTPILEPDAANPFVENMRGQFRPVNSYAYLGEREYEYNTAGETDIRNDGIYKEFSPYWNYDNASNEWIQDETDWTWTSAITEFNPYGPEVENINALYQSSAAVFGYNNTLPIAVGANTTYSQIGYDGFEDYNFDATNSLPKHFSFEGNGILTQEEAHTGLYSMKLDIGQQISCLRSLDAEPRDDFSDVDPVPFQNVPYPLSSRDLLKAFGPETYDTGGAYELLTDDLNVPLSNTQVEALKEDKVYVLSYWVKEKTLFTNTKKFNYDAHQVAIQIDGVNIDVTSKKISEIIEGWVRVESYFTIPENSEETIELVFSNPPCSPPSPGSGGGNVNCFDRVFIDDVRIHPFDGSMKSYVYHPQNLRLLAELDDNNFATIYEYDEEGRLLRIKKETERGLMTIQESRTNTKLPN